MGLGTRTTEPRKVISLFDEVMALIPQDRVHKYALSRNLEDLGDLSGLTVLPVFFTLAPLSTKFEHLADNDWSCLQFHLTDLENAPAAWNQAWTVYQSGNRGYNDDCMEKIPRDTLIELARVIRELANGDTTPFSPPVGWQGWRARALALAAARAADSPPDAGHAN